MLWANASGADLLRQGLVAMQSGKLADAEQYLQKASQADDKNPFVWASLAEARRRQSENQPALNAAAKAEQLSKGDPVVSHALAMFYSQMNQPERAAQLEQIYAESKKADPEARSRAAELYHQAGMQRGSKDGMADLAKAWELAGNRSGSIAFDYAQALLKEQSFAEAADLAGKLAEANPKDPQWELILGVARYGQRRFDDAVSAFLQTIAIDASVPQPYLFLGNLLEQAGPRLDDVIAAEKAWAEREPTNAMAQLTLAKALLQKDRRSEPAKALLEKAIALQPGDWEGHYQLGVWLESARDFPEAAKELEAATTLKPEQPLPHYHLARVYDRLGMKDKADEQRTIHSRLTEGKP